MEKQIAPVIYFGGDYNPDQWDEATIRQDMEYFKRCHINYVALPVFSWAKLEPEEGVYQFEWLDKILSIIWENGIYVCLATSTAAQPEWMSKKYPEIMPVDNNGLKRTHGMRNFYCVNSEKYRERAAAMAEQMALRYKDFPGLVAWHVANEYSTFCHCENCEKKFRLWLKKKYGTTENLNEKWNTAFWGRTVYDFDTIMLPTDRNDDDKFFPAKQLDYQRFVTDTTEECFLNEANVLRRITPDIPVFSNISGFIKKLNQFQLTRNMDFAGWDNYPSPKDDSAFPALKHDIMRGLKDGASYMVAEQSPNQQNWQPYNKLKRPGEVRLLAYQGIAHGGDSALYFQMRQSVGGQEKFHGAVISHSGRTDTRIFREFEQLGEELDRLGGQILDARTKAEVGILFDWDNWWALENCSGPTCDMDYLAQVAHYYRAFHRKNIPVDIVKFTADLSQYKMIVAPLAYMMKEGLANRLKAFAEQGGTVVGTYMTGLADENDRCVFGAYPGPLRELFGIWVEETDALFPEEQNGIRMEDSGKSYVSGFLCDRIRTEGAKVLGRYEKDFYAGEPCVTEHAYGNGKAFYLGTQPDAAFLDDFLGGLCKERQILPVLDADEGVEATCRENQNGKFYFVLNHDIAEKTVRLPEGIWEDLTHQCEREGAFSLTGRDVAVLKKKGESER
ncbi:MAG: beta-galactosidase [Eubacteriales bacterium]|nr:beta-galactosidase [Eubacteriales bacterium]